MQIYKNDFTRAMDKRIMCGKKVSGFGFSYAEVHRENRDTLSFCISLARDEMCVRV